MVRTLFRLLLVLVAVSLTCCHDAFSRVLAGPTDGTLNVNLTSVGYNYAMPITVGGVPLYMIADTGNNQFTVLDHDYRTDTNPHQSSIPFPANNPAVFYAYTDNVYECLYLLEDNVQIAYKNKFSTDSSSPNCYGALGSIQVDGTMTGESASLYPRQFSITNQVVVANQSVGNLHPWGQGGQGGNVGMAYSGRGVNNTIWESLLIATTGGKNGMFGLDFRALGGSMQLGGLKKAYAGAVQWARQGFDNPQYHNVLIKNLGMCGAQVNLFGVAPGLNSMRVMVDTGQVCLQLPQEIYDAFLGWLPTGPFATGSELPFFSFQVDSGNISSWSLDHRPSRGDLLYVKLSDLLVGADEMGGGSQPDGIPVVVGSQSLKLCILPTQNIYTSGADSSMTNSPPTVIVFGALPLRSLYFAADMGTTSVGLAPKQDAAEVDAMYASSTCSAPVTCIGQQIYDPTYNTCNRPSCSQYYFVFLDEASQTCYYRLDYYNAGVIIISLCVILETWSFFVMQYSGLQVLGIESGDYAYTRPMNTKVDWLSYHVGKALTRVLDEANAWIARYTEA
jgi:hypothetical protein